MPLSKKEVREGRIVGGGRGGGGGGGAVDTYGNRIVQGNFNPGNSNEVRKNVGQAAT